MVRESANRGHGPRHGPRLQLVESRLREEERLQERRIGIGELKADLGTYLARRGQEGHDLCVTRLTDPPETARAANLTIQRLPEFCGPVKLPIKELEEQLNAAT